MKILVLVTDAFGGHGGIAKFNRDLLKAVCNYQAVRSVLCLPRIVRPFSEKLPTKLSFLTAAAKGKNSYLCQLLKAASTKPDLVLCGHIHLLPLAFLYRLFQATPVILIIHGIDAWQPTGRVVTDFLAKRVKHFIAVSQYSRRRFCEWTKLPEAAGSILPNCVDLSLYGPGSKKLELLRRYGIEGRKVILTLGRLAAAERYKGFDEVLELMPDLLRAIPHLTYMIAGDGPDHERLVSKAELLGFAVFDYSKASGKGEICGLSGTPTVVFTGRIEESEKADHYRLADVYVMPSRGEGFGIVFLEAMACGVPTVGSKVDGSAEALMGGALGKLVDPQNPEEIRSAILETLACDQRPRLPQLAIFSYSEFEKRVAAMLASALPSSL